MENKQTGSILPQAFYLDTDVVAIAQNLLGKVLVTQFDGIQTAGLIVETEAYRGADDKACHAYPHKRTPRTEAMFLAGGHAYIYLCYGMHHLFNIVTGPENTPNAVLIRAIEPIQHIEVMLQRRQQTQVSPRLTAGPGALAQALGIHVSYSGKPLLAHTSPFWIEEPPYPSPSFDIQIGTRVGVQYAGTCAHRPWRFSIAGSKWVSKAKGS